MQKSQLVAAALVALAMAAPAARGEVQGQVSLKGANFAVADAVAYRTEDGIEVALLPVAFDRTAAAKDQKIDSFDVMRMGKAYITLRIGNDGSFNCIDYSPGQGGGSACNSDYATALALTTRTAERVAGTFRLKAGGDAADVKFDLKVESAVSRSGTALPANGGEPGRAVLAHFSAIEKNDFEALKVTARPGQRGHMESAEKSGEAKAMFKMMRDMSPQKVKVTGGTVDGDAAMVDFEGVSDGRRVSGVAECVRIGGKWYMKGSSTRQ